MKRSHLLVGVLIVVLALSAVPSSLAVVQATKPARPQADFNGDWYADLAVGVPGEDIGSVLDAGAVNVLYGAAGNGLSTAHNRTWSQDDAGVVDTAEAGDQFGVPLAVGDFNGDGYVDLAVGVPNENVGALVKAGAVHILYGSAAGLTATGNQLLSQDSPGIQGTAENLDRFGSALAAGDFNGDGYDDLAVGVPGESVGSPVVDGAGAVNVLYGSAAGLGGNNQLWHQDVSGVGGGAEEYDHFGSSLATGDFDGDSYADLAVGVPFEHVGSVGNAGAVNILYGSTLGLTATGNQIWDQDSAGIQDTAEASDFFGNALAVGDFDGDGYADLAVGVPYEDVGSITGAGAVNIFYGSATGLTSTGDQLWHQDVAGVAGGAEEGDSFGWRLAAGDFDGDGRADLAVGVPFEAVGSIRGAGAVNILYGSAAGLTATGNQIWDQDSVGIQDTAEAGDFFGGALAVGDFDGDSYADLAVGVPFEHVGSISDAGAVNVLYGSATGLTRVGNQLWHQDILDVAGAAEADDFFGYALAAIPRTTHRVFMPLTLKK